MACPPAPFRVCIILLRHYSLMVRIHLLAGGSSLSRQSAGSVFVSGSNPNSDYNVAPGVTYKTEYRTERFYPSYYNERRPEPTGLLKQLSYGGPSFNVSLSADDLSNDVNNIKDATVIIVRTGFSTHAMVNLITFPFFSCIDGH